METKKLERIAINEKTQMRDAVFNRLYELSENDRDIMVFTADQGARALDRWRTDKAEQYRDVGIAEQALVSIGAGMAKEGKKVFIYAITPFITTRIHEFHKVNAGVQRIPYNVIGVGAGFSYEESGPTHYTVEDVAIMSAIPNMEIYTPSDSVMAAAFAEMVMQSDKPSYIRLDRDVLPIITNESENLEQGFRELVQGRNNCIISTGYMVHQALDVQKRLLDENIDCSVIDLYRNKPINEEGLVETLQKYKNIVTLEEHFLEGGLGSMALKLKNNFDLPQKIFTIGIPVELMAKNYYKYGRKNIHKELGLDVENVIRIVKKL